MERRGDPLITRWMFVRRMIAHGGAAVLLVLTALSIGVVGYRFVCGLSWVDSLLNASMILGGMGPVDTLKSDGAKVFASMYALLSGLVFIFVAGILLSPVVHRIVHHFHLESDV